MGSIGGLSNSTSANMYGTSIKGYSGLASGMDTDSLIEGMTTGTRNKITEALRDKTKYQWQTDAYRSISDKLVGFDVGHLDVASSNSVYRASFFDKSIVAMNGSNSRYLDVTGASAALESMGIIGIKQLAKDASIVTRGASSVHTLNTGAIQLGDTITSKLDGKTLKFQYGSKSYALSLDSGVQVTYREPSGTTMKITTDFTTVDNAVQSINALLKQETAGNGTLGDKIKAEKSADGRIVFKALAEDSNTLKLSGGDKEALELLGLEADKPITASGLTGSKVLTDTDLQVVKSFAEMVGEKSITFSYNGTAKQIKLPDQETIEAWSLNSDGSQPADEDEANQNRAVNLTKYLQKQLDTAYGTDRVIVHTADILGDGDEVVGKGLSFETPDDSSVFKITAADAGLMGPTGIFATSFGETNRLNRDVPLANSGLAGMEVAGWDNATTLNPDGSLKLVINGVDINADKKLTKNSTINDIINKINSSDAGVKVKYLETADCFTVVATNHGAAGKVELSGDFSKVLFGSSIDAVTGQDAVMTVEFEGGAQRDITRDTNNFNLDGTTFTLKGEFGFERNDDGSLKIVDGHAVEAAGNERVTFTTSVDADKVAEEVKSLIEDYNKILKEVYDQVSTRPDRDYGPLSDEEKEGLSESEIKKLEDKAKEGLLFNDSLLRSLSTKLRTVFSGAADVGTLKQMGITVSSSYADNGKITFNEEKFKSALIADPEKVKNIFTRPATKTDLGDGKIVEDMGGIAVRLKAIMTDFASTRGETKGSLIEKAGSSFAPTTLLDNDLKKRMDKIDDQVENLKDKLQDEIDRYSRQFTTLEQLIAQMNSQSSWFGQMMGG